MTVVIGAVAVTVKQRQAAGHGAFRPGMLEITAQGQQSIGPQIRFQDAIQGLPLLLISVLPVLPVLIGQHHPATDAGILIEAAGEIDHAAQHVPGAAAQADVA